MPAGWLGVRVRQRRRWWISAGLQESGGRIPSVLRGAAASNVWPHLIFPYLRDQVFPKRGCCEPLQTRAVGCTGNDRVTLMGCAELHGKCRFPALLISRRIDAADSAAADQTTSEVSRGHQAERKPSPLHALPRSAKATRSSLSPICMRRSSWTSRVGFGASGRRQARAGVVSTIYASFALHCLGVGRLARLALRAAASNITASEPLRRGRRSRPRETEIVRCPGPPEHLRNATSSAGRPTRRPAPAAASRKQQGGTVPVWYTSRRSNLSAVRLQLQRNLSFPCTAFRLPY